MSGFANPQEDTNALRIVLASGSAASPSLVFANDLTQGLYWTPDGIVLSGQVSSGVSSIHADSNPNLIGAVHFVSGSNVTLTQVGQDITVAAASGGVTYPLLAPDGSGTAPSYAFSSNPMVGFWYDASETNVVLSNDTTQPGFVIPQNCNLVFGASNYSASIFASYNSGTLEFFGAANGQILAMDTNTNANETRLLLWDITAATLQRVSIGAADSGGTGFRVLRIPN